MRNFARLVLAAGVAIGLPALAQAKVQITVDLDTQTIHVESKDKVYDWKISSGASGYDTPTGSYGVLWMDKDHKSDEYDGAPMPNAIFFKPGFAIHGSPKSNWGHPASHGCVRLPVKDSAILFDLVKAEGADVKIIGDTPATLEAHKRRRDEDRGDYYASAPTYYETAPGYGDAPAAGYVYAPRRASQSDGFFGSVY